MPETFPERLRAIRKSKKLTQKQLAEKAGIRTSLISWYERGIHSPRIDIFEWICKALDVSATELLGF